MRRDWITVKEYAEQRGKKTITIHKQIERNRFPHPYERVADSGNLILIFVPQKTEAQPQEVSGKVTCDYARNR